MDKPLVSYVRLYLPVIKGEETLLTVIDQDGKSELRLTSPVVDVVVRVNDNRPVFETMNTIYVPANQK